MSKFNLLFTPFEIPPVHLKNRIVMNPLFTGYALEDGSVSRLTLEHYRQIAQGGAAMIVVANVAVTRDGALSLRSLLLDEDRFIPGLKKLAEVIKNENCIAALQLNHGGRFSRSKNAAAPSRVPISDFNWRGFYKIALKSQDMEKKWSILSDAFEKKTPVEMTVEDIREVVDAYANAAGRAKQAGFDMVEIHGATGYLPVQFFSPRTNLRNDEYGGSIENRMRFCAEMVSSIKDAVGKNYPVGYRFLADEWMPGGVSIEEAEALAAMLEKLKIAYLSITAGVYESFSNPEIIEKTKKPYYMASLTKRIRKAVQTPLITSGRIITPDLAEKILKDGDADLVGLARPLLVDPNWPKKARSGRQDSIKLCKNCGVCFKMVVADRPVICSQFERQKRLKRKQVLREMRNLNKKVLIAMDGSENAAMGAAYAGDMLSTVPGVHIAIVHIRTEESKKREIEIRNMLDVSHKILLEKGIPDEAVTVVVKRKINGVASDILDEIEAGGFGTVVVGRRGLSMAKRLLFGSVSNKIVQNAKNCTVWVVD